MPCKGVRKIIGHFWQAGIPKWSVVEISDEMFLVPWGQPLIMLKFQDILRTIFWDTSYGALTLSDMSIKRSATLDLGVRATCIWCKRARISGVWYLKLRNVWGSWVPTRSGIKSISFSFMLYCAINVKNPLLMCTDKFNVAKITTGPRYRKSVDQGLAIYGQLIKVWQIYSTS